MELMHHGIKGQKWNVRRYQYKDGTWTPAGKKRYNKSSERRYEGTLNSTSSRVNNSVKTGTKAKLNTNTSSKPKIEVKAKNKDKNTNNENIRTDTRNTKSLKDMTDKELIAVNKRMQQEANYKKNMKERSKEDGPDPLETAKEFVQSGAKALKEKRNELRKEIENRPKKRLDLSEMTDADLNRAINRARLEKQYMDIFAEQVDIPKGKRAVSSLLDKGVGLMEVGGTALGLAIMIKQLKGKL